VNRLRERLSRALDAERAFAANSAHELRTPVAAARAQAQLLADELREGPSAERARALAATLGRLSRLVEKLLQLSRASSGVALNRQETDLAAIVRVVVNEYRSRKVDTARIVLDPDPPPATSVFTDPDALGIVVQNLIDNALTHGDRTQPVVVSVGAGSSVSVINAGPAVAPDVLASLKQRFVRGPTRAEGSGLGLSIVEAIVAQAGARLDLHSPARGRDDGFEAVVTFPPAP
jgi:two-component system OmpR family sensor kinase